MKVHLLKRELASMPKEELQETLNKYIKAGFIPAGITLNDVRSLEELLEEKLVEIENEMFSLPDLVWENEYHVDEEATSKVCPEYVRLVKEHERLATELNNLKHRNLC